MGVTKDIIKVGDGGIILYLFINSLSRILRDLTLHVSLDLQTVQNMDRQL